ncbi:glycosyltransferase [Kineococcus aurantiacus]|uniref:GT2 family glycosyltransferase n=1 Tax=Kineococcus aurantiacus TaxID=37633 RepID=A0A7Y9DN93_9ACTN|nr:GT2 family glycosyltransferase [Kineococcus aurantiacus]
MAEQQHEQQHEQAREDDRVSVVLITWQRREEALLAVRRLLELPERPRVIVLDNASTDGTADALRAEHPRGTARGDRLDVVVLPENQGAVARNTGVASARTPYVAFCDDDTWWDPGSLARAADLLDADDRVAVLTARILVEPGGVEDDIVAELRDSPVRGAPGLPGPALGSFLAGASVVRRSAFLEVGGFSKRLWLGGEEELLAADLAARGWELCYVEDLQVHHQASVLRESTRRRRNGIRNTLWFTWLRRPLPAAARRTRDLLTSLPRDRTSALGVLDAVAGLPWLVRERRVLPPHAEARFAALEEAQRTSTARDYSR